jgi:hypothetical protein
MTSKEFKCNICNKLYTSYKSLWNHNKLFHKNKTTSNVTKSNDNVTNNNDNVTKSNDNVTNNNNDNIIETTTNKKSLKCEYCNKILSTRQSKSEHKKKSCKLNPNNPNNNIIITPEIVELKKKNEELEKSINELKDLLIKNCKKQNYILQPKTIQKININNNNNNNSNNICSSNMFINYAKNIITFNNNPIKFFYYDSQIYFKAKDIAKILDYENTFYKKS